MKLCKNIGDEGRRNVRSRGRSIGDQSRDPRGIIRRSPGDRSGISSEAGTWTRTGSLGWFPGFIGHFRRFALWRAASTPMPSWLASCLYVIHSWSSITSTDRGGASGDQHQPSKAVCQHTRRPPKPSSPQIVTVEFTTSRSRFRTALIMSQEHKLDPLAKNVYLCDAAKLGCDST